MAAGKDRFVEETGPLEWLERLEDRLRGACEDLSRIVGVEGLAGASAGGAGSAASARAAGSASVKAVAVLTIVSSPCRRYQCCIPLTLSATRA